MKELKNLDRFLTKHFVIAAASIIALLVASLVTLVVVFPERVETAGTVVDILLKCVAVIVGGAWALNRYFTTRTDELQIRVDADVQAIPAGSFRDTPHLGLLIARLDIVNTGKSLMPQFDQRLIVDSVHPTSEGLGGNLLYQWPGTGTHPAGQIEPGSWSAINFSCPIPSSTLAVRIYLEIYIGEASTWTWHKTFKIAEATSLAPSVVKQGLSEGAAYRRCPNCGSDREGVHLYRCDSCGVVFCADCGRMGDLRTALGARVL